jgi:hypothetical protein
MHDIAVLLLRHKRLALVKLALSLSLFSRRCTRTHTQRAHKKQTTNRTKVYGVTIGVARAQPASGRRGRNVLVANKFFGVISLSQWMRLCMAHILAIISG